MFSIFAKKEGDEIQWRQSGKALQTERNHALSEYFRVKQKKKVWKNLPEGRKGGTFMLKLARGDSTIVAI